MTDTFISYSRKDKDFAHHLADALLKSGRDIWVDWEDIPQSAMWQDEIFRGIENTNAFIFVISPDSIASKVCTTELEYALKLNKRIIPVLCREISGAELHPAIAPLSWIYFRTEDEFESSFANLAQALDTDLNHVRAHTRLLARAREWSDHSKNNSFLLRGNDLQSAEAWLMLGMHSRPSPTDLQVEYVFASRQASTRQQRTLILGVLFGIGAMLAISLVALLQNSRINELQAQLNGTVSPENAKGFPPLEITFAATTGIFLLTTIGLVLYVFVYRASKTQLITMQPQTTNQLLLPKITQHTFLSYSRKDEKVMKHFRDLMKEKGLTIWTDENLVVGSPEWEREIEKAIKGAGCLAVLLSPDSNESVWVRREISFAETFEIRIFPILIRGNERDAVPARLINHQRINAQSDENLAIENLCTAIFDHLTNVEFHKDAIKVSA